MQYQYCAKQNAGILLDMLQNKYYWLMCES